MIIRPYENQDAEHEVLRRHLEKELRLVLAPVPGGGPDYIEEMAAALATMWAIDFRRTSLPSSVFYLLASRLLCGLGRGQQAGDLLRATMTWGARTDTVLRVMKRGGPSLAACTLLAGGTLRPADSALCAGGSWVLDVNRVAGPGDPLLELQVLSRLRRVLDGACDLFAEDRGRGQLVLTGVGRGRGGWRPGLPGGRELCRFCREILDRTADGRGWTQVPGVHLGDPVHRPGAGKHFPPAR